VVVEEDASGSDDDIPELIPQNFISKIGKTPEEMSQQQTATPKPKQTRSEKKTRRAISRLGLKPVTGIYKVTVKKPKNVSCLV